MSTPNAVWLITLEYTENNTLLYQSSEYGAKLSVWMVMMFMLYDMTAIAIVKIKNNRFGGWLVQICNVHKIL